jgi:long-chain acyl-CoA synthetase
LHENLFSVNGKRFRKSELMVSGSAALQTRLAIFLLQQKSSNEGYGLTETSPVISVNDLRNKGFRVGTVGKVIDSVEVKMLQMEKSFAKDLM